LELALGLVVLPIVEMAASGISMRITLGIGMYVVAGE
jgi:hypothetical protein